MYWRFRHITRNRLRLQSWWTRRRQISAAPAARPYRPRGVATTVHRGSSRRTWTALIVMVSILTALRVLAAHVLISGSLLYAVGALTIVGAIYLALRGV